MKHIILMSVLLLSGAAYAQETSEAKDCSSYSDLTVPGNSYQFGC